MLLDLKMKDVRRFLSFLASLGLIACQQEPLGDQALTVCAAAFGEWKAGRPEEALGVLETAAQMEPRWYSPHVTSACILESIEKLDEALEEYEEAMQLLTVYGGGIYPEGIVEMDRRFIATKIQELQAMIESRSASPKTSSVLGG